MSIANELPQSPIAKAKEIFRARSTIRHVYPGIAIEQGHVPFYGRAEFRDRGPASAPRRVQIGHVEIEILTRGHAPKNRYLILNGMGSEGENAESDG